MVERESEDSQNKKKKKATFDQNLYKIIAEEYSKLDKSARKDTDLFKILQKKDLL
jgi:hypothetical protein